MTSLAKSTLQSGRAKVVSFFAAFLVFPTVEASDCRSSGDQGEVSAIIAARQSFNLAIATADLQRIESVLHMNAILVTGTHSEVFLGREAQVTTWRSDFESADRALYVRTTTCVRVSAAAPVALESGTWLGKRDSTADFSSGSYAAKWRRVDGAWKIEAEIYLTEACGGEFCPASKDSAR